MDKSCEALIKFRKDGVAYSPNKRIEQDIQKLKLNLLSEARKKVIDKAREKIKRYKNWNNDLLDAEIEKWKALKHTRYGLAYVEFCMAAINYLENKKKR